MLVILSLIFDFQNVGYISIVKFINISNDGVEIFVFEKIVLVSVGECYWKIGE